MDPERVERIDAVFQASLDLPPGARADYLSGACAGDLELRREVESLLACHERASDFIAGSAADVAAELLAREQNLTGRSVGAYNILSPLGAGGMGEIYLAEDARLGRKVALKLLPASFAHSGESVRRFRQEARATSALNHPNILTVHEVGQWQGRDFIATEYVEGVTLRTRMRGRGLPLAAAVDIALQVAGALEAAHGAGIVHRDVKPENVMVRPDGLVKVLDFGIAKYAEPARGRGRRQEQVKTATGMVIGTTAYMSPEQARGEEVDARADVWSLGVVLYEMVGRRLPFPGRTPTERVAAILEREPEPLGRLRRGVPAGLERIVNRALTKDRDERYARAADLADELRRLRTTLGEERPMRFALSAPARRFLFSRRRRALALAALLLLIAAAGAAVFFYLRSPPRPAVIDSLAVLPLVDAGGGDTEYLSDGLTESLINSLSQLPGLKVKSRGSVSRYKGQEVDVRGVGETLDVRAVLTGRVAQRGDDLSVSVELVDTRDSRHLWGAQYSRKLAALVGLQNEITRDVSRQLRARLSGADEQRLAKNYTENSEAYQLYLRGRYHLLKHTRAEIQTSISHFRQAIETDPSYALAYVGLADAYSMQALPGEMPPTELMPQAKAAAQKAVEIDDRLAEAHAILGAVIFWHDWDWDEAENHLRRSLEFDPNSAVAHYAYANLLFYTGRQVEGLAEIKRARELDPLNLRINVIEATLLTHAGQADEALARLRQTLQLDPNYWFARQYAASAYVEKGMFAEAIAEARRARESNGVASRPTAFLGYALAKSGRRAEARAEVEGLVRSAKERYVSPYNIAMVYNGLGEREETLAWLERGYRQKEPRMVFLKAEPKWNNLRDDPRFQDLLRRVGFPP